MAPHPLSDLRVVAASPDDLSRYLDLLEELADWLHSRGINQWPPGRARAGADYYAASITRGEVHLALVGDELAGAFRLLERDPIVWPEMTGDDALYLYNLAVSRAWSGKGIGHRLLAWSEQRTLEAGRAYLRLDCFPENAFLRRYYEEAGFVARGEVNAVYPVVGAMHLRRYEKQVA